MMCRTGALYMTPAPSVRHQTISIRLVQSLRTRARSTSGASPTSYADPELQPRVAAARARLEGIIRERG
ncbi:MAG: hypothetical protein ACODAA_00545 [Gemmatimonadota bacterium]